MYNVLYRDPSSLNATGLNIPCMAEYGGPVDPSVALGGYCELCMASSLIVKTIFNLPAIYS